MTPDSQEIKDRKDRIDLEAVREAYRTMPATLMSVFCFVVVAGAIVPQVGNRVVWVISGFAGATALQRISVLLLFGEKASNPALTAAGARRIQVPFAISHYLYAIAMGTFCASTYFVGRPEMHMLSVGLLLGYGAGVSTHLPLRPWIAVPNMLIAVLPSICLQLRLRDPLDVCAAVLLVTLLAGSIHRILQVNHSTSSLILRREAFSILARSDPLTGMPNRLALSEWFATREPEAGGTSKMAVLFLDLDRFKPINDTLGHQVGDKLLIAIAKRLQTVLRSRSFAARIGGDEFVVIDPRMAREADVRTLAERIVKAISEPYSIDGHQVTVGVSVGCVSVSDREDDLDVLLSRADSAMYRVKHTAERIGIHG